MMLSKLSGALPIAGDSLGSPFFEAGAGSHPAVLMGRTFRDQGMRRAPGRILQDVPAILLVLEGRGKSREVGCC